MRIIRTRRRRCGSTSFITASLVDRSRPWWLMSCVYVRVRYPPSFLLTPLFDLSSRSFCLSPPCTRFYRPHVLVRASFIHFRLFSSFFMHVSVRFLSYLTSSLLQRVKHMHTPHPLPYSSALPVILDLGLHILPRLVSLPLIHIISYKQLMS